MKLFEIFSTNNIQYQLDTHLRLLCFIEEPVERQILWVCGDETWNINLIADTEAKQLGLYGAHRGV